MARYSVRVSELEVLPVTSISQRFRPKGTTKTLVASVSSDQVVPAGTLLNLRPARGRPTVTLETPTMTPQKMLGVAPTAASSTKPEPGAPTLNWTGSPGFRSTSVALTWALYPDATKNSC